jgi:hypothetical protein
MVREPTNYQTNRGNTAWNHTRTYTHTQLVTLPDPRNQEDSCALSCIFLPTFFLFFCLPICSSSVFFLKFSFSFHSYFYCLILLLLYLIFLRIFFLIFVVLFTLFFRSSLPSPPHLLLDSPDTLNSAFITNYR